MLSQSLSKTLFTHLLCQTARHSERASRRRGIWTARTDCTVCTWWTMPIFITEVCTGKASGNNRQLVVHNEAVIGR